MILNGRDVEILIWLVHMKFMTLDQIGRAFFKECNPNRACYRRILKLMKAGYIQSKKVYIEPKDVYVPTRKAVVILHQGGSRYPLGLSKDKYLSSYEHDRTVTDIRILFRDLGIETWVPERVIRSCKPRGACPDALLVTGEGGYAIEYERTEKRLIRYKDILNRYDSREAYDCVLYICQTESMISRIKNKYHPSRKFYFIKLRDLFDQRERATFFSMSDGLPLGKLVHESTGVGLEHLDPECVDRYTKPKPDESWKNRRPYIGVPKSSRHDDKDYDDYAEHYHGNGDEVDAYGNPTSVDENDWDQHDY